LFAGTEKIESDGTDLSFTVGATGDINIGSAIGLTFGDDGEKIEGDGTDLTVTGNNIKLTATADVVVPKDVGVTFGDGEKIEGNDTNLTVTSGGTIALNATGAGGVIVPANVGILYGTGDSIIGDNTDLVVTVGGDLDLDVTGSIDIPTGITLEFVDTGETISGNGTDLTLASGVDINLTATSAINMPTGVPIEFVDSGEKISGNGTDLTLNSGADINLTPTTAVNMGTKLLTFGSDSDAISGDGTDLTITSNGNLNLTSTVNEADSIKIEENATGGAGTIKLYANQSTQATSIHLLSDLGGITLDTGPTDDDIHLTAGADVNIPANVGLTFGADTHKIESDATDVTFTSNGNLNLVSTVAESASVYIRENAGTAGTIKIHADQGDTATSIEIVSDVGGITLDTGPADDLNLTVGAAGDINIPADIGLQFGSGEAIEGDDTNLTLTSGANIALNATGAGGVTVPASVGILYGTGDTIVGDNDDITVTVGRDLIITPTSSMNITSGGIEITEDVTTKLASNYQKEVRSVTFDVEEATLDADDGAAGIKIASIALNFNALVTGAWVDVSQGCGDAGDTAGLLINDTDDNATIVTTLVAQQDCAAASLLAYTPTSSTSVPIGKLTATNQYVIVTYLDIGNDGSTSANLQGTLVVEYIRY